MRKEIIFKCIVAGLLLILPLSVNANGYNNLQSSVDNKVEMTVINLHVWGGVGININIRGITDQTVISTSVNGVLMSAEYSSPVIFKTQLITISTLTLLPRHFELYININGQPFSYEGSAFLMFTWSIKPIDV